MKYFRKTGSEGGKARAARHSKEELSAWGKKGGRPRKTESIKAKKGDMK